MVDPAGETEWEYDSRGRVITETRVVSDTWTFVTSWGYNSADAVKWMQYPGGDDGETVAEHVTKGRQVLVEGRIDVGEEGRFNVIAEWVVFGALTAKSSEGSPEEG